VAVVDRSEVQRALEELAFLWVEQGKRPEVARFYEGMLTEVIPSEGEWWERTAWETLQDREDAAAFMEIGNAWSEEYSPAYQRNPLEALRKAIAAYEEALRFWTPDIAPLDYAMTQNNLGSAYGRLSEYEDPVGNLRRAIEAYEEALRFRTPEGTPLFYAGTQYEMGLAYRRRAELQTDRAQRCMDLQAAVRAFREALRFRTPEAAPRWHEETRKALEEAEEALRQAGCPGSP
jgi:tetratricopeptide (TPR) repeat protein